MLPTTLLPHLSPIAAKLYLTLLTLQDKNAPTVRAPLKSLCTLTNLSDKSCRRALNQLRSLNLLATLPRHYQKPSTYILLTPLSDRSPKTAPSPNKPVPQDRTSSPSSQHTPVPAAKTPDRSHLTHLLNLYRASQKDRTPTRPSQTNRPLGTQVYAALSFCFAR